MKQLTKDEIEKTGYQSRLQFGSRVEVRGIKGIVNHCSANMCRVFYGFGKYIEAKPDECRLLTVDEAVGV